LEGEDAVFFQNVMSAILETRHESERQARLEEARVWFDKWRLHETQDFAWASERLAMLQQMVEDKGVVIYMTKEMAETICNLAENDPSVPLIEAKYSGMPLANLKKLSLTVRAVQNEMTEAIPSLFARLPFPNYSEESKDTRVEESAICNQVPSHCPESQ